MPIDIKIPKVGESISEVQINEWLKAPGDEVRKDEPLAIIDSEKTTFELPATDSGRLTKILHQAGETVSVGSVVAQLEPGEISPPSPAPAPAAVSPSASEPPPPAASKGKRPASAPPDPPTERMAGPGRGQSTTSDIKPRDDNKSAPETAAPDKAEVNGESAEPAPMPPPDVVPGAPPSSQEPLAGAEEEVVPMTMLRRTVARRLVEAKQTMAMLTTFNEVDMSSVQRLRHEHQEAFRARHGVKLGLMSFFVKAAVDALKQFPQLNAEVRGTDIVYRNYFDIGIALASERGLVVPVLQRVERSSFADIEKAIGDFSRRAREIDLHPRDLEGGTFTITNGGVFGSLLSTPIINPPQSAILGLHTIEERPVARDGEVVIRPMMYIALTYDHRIVDGREAVLFLRRIREAVESPARMLLEV